MKNGLGGVQSVLVLGGGSDIALETVKALAADRCELAILAARNPDKLTDQVATLVAAGVAKVETVTFDGADPASHLKFIDDTFESATDIDLVICAFGLLGSQDLLDVDPEAAAHLVSVNFAGSVSALTAVAGAMKRQGHGTIVVLSSVAGERVRSDNAVYGASKAGLDAYCQGLADRLVGTGVEVMVVRPGFVHTKMTAGMEAAPFSTTPDKVAADIVSGLAKGSTTVWSPAILRFVFMGMRHLPRPIWRKISAR